jgi:hypothetical protein
VTQASRNVLLTVEAWVEILACRARLGLPRLLAGEPFLRRELTQQPASESRPSGSVAPLLTAFWTALRAQPGVPGCLPRSLALRRFLARHGQGGRLELGLRKLEGRMGGHAWVEAGGTILSGDGPFVRSFVRLETPPAARASRRTDG